MFGKDKIKNAVHCTDLPEDGLIEVSVIVFLCLLLLTCNSCEALTVKFSSLIFSKEGLMGIFSLKVYFQTSLLPPAQ